jgi:hypothetical protein
MKLDKITLQFTADEIEAIHYAINLGVRSYGRNKPKCADDWIDKAEEIRKMLPTKLHLEDLKSCV